MKIRVSCFSLSIAVILLIQSAISQPFVDPCHHQVRFVAVGPDARLEVLDWGGKGRSIVFLAALANTAHVFDDFAPQFIDTFHVWGITCRGFGASSQSPLTTLRAFADDIRTVMDSLDIPSAILIGHSFAGDEMTKFASVYPERVQSLVYLDAAYDRVGIEATNRLAPPPPSPTSIDFSSLENMRKYLARTYPQIAFPVAEVRSWFTLSSEGRIVGLSTPDSNVRLGMSNIEHPAYALVQSPALAIYAIPETIDQKYAYLTVSDSVARANAQKALSADRQWIDSCRQQFVAHARRGTVLTIMGAHHYVFLSHPKQVAATIRQFLSSH